MGKTTLLAATLVGMVVFGRAVDGSVLAEPSSQSALTGKMTSQAEGAMEGVPVGQEGGLDDDDVGGQQRRGQYSFPLDRMEPGNYAVSIRASGYELPATSVNVTAEPTELNLRLTKVTGVESRHAGLERGVADERARHATAETRTRGLRELPHAAARALLPFRRRRDDERDSAHVEAHE